MAAARCLLKWLKRPPWCHHLQHEAPLPPRMSCRGGGSPLSLSGSDACLSGLIRCGVNLMLRQMTLTVVGCLRTW